MDKLFQLLDSLSKRPAMYVGWATLGHVRSFVFGLRAGLDFAGVTWSRDDYDAAAQARGWDPSGSRGIESDFQKKGLSEPEMIREFVAVEADAYRRALARADRTDDENGAADRRAM